MKDMFKNCSNLELNVNSWDTSSITSLKNIFSKINYYFKETLWEKQYDRKIDVYFSDTDKVKLIYRDGKEVFMNIECYSIFKKKITIQNKVYDFM